MEPSSKIPLVVIEPSCFVTLVGKILNEAIKNPRPILWNREGSYGWISAVRIRNAIRRRTDSIKAADNNYDTKPQWLKFNWNETTRATEHLAQAIEEMSKLLK